MICRFKDDLYIIDQHASDEKFRYETLQRTTTINSQKMLFPKSLEITRQMEITILENLEIFEKNGFKFIIDEEAEPTKKIKLTSKTHIFQFNTFNLNISLQIS